MMTPWILSAVLAVLCGTQTVRLHRARPRRAVNVVDGVILPMPDDPRWVTGDRFSTSSEVLRLAQVRVIYDHYYGYSVHIGGVMMPRTRGTNRYARAVQKGYQNRLALEAIEGAS